MFPKLIDVVQAFLQSSMQRLSFNSNVKSRNIHTSFFCDLIQHFLMNISLNGSNLLFEGQVCIS